MSSEFRTQGRRAASVVALTTAKRAMRSGAVWGLLVGVLAANEALSYHTSFPTLASREKFAQSFGHTPRLLR